MGTPDTAKVYGRVMLTRRLERLVMVFVAVNCLGIYTYIRGRAPCEEMIRGLSSSLARNPPPPSRHLRATGAIASGGNAQPCTACPGRPKLPSRTAGARGHRVDSSAPARGSTRCFVP